MPISPSFPWRKREYFISKNPFGVEFIDFKGDLKDTLIQEFDSNNSDSVLFEFLSINPSHSNEILDFCNKYGRLGLVYLHDCFPGFENEKYDNFDEYADERVNEDSDAHKANDYIDNEYYFAYTGYEPLDAYRYTIQIFKAVVSLYEAINELDFINMIDRLLFLVTSFECFRYDGECEDTENPLPKNSDGEYPVTNKYRFSRGENFSPSEDRIDLTQALSGEVYYESGFDLSAYVGSLLSTDKDLIINYAKDFLCSFVNEQIRNVRLVMNPTNGNKYLGSSFSPSLLKILYYFLYLKITEGKIIRKCANSTCSSYFQIFGNDNRKMYCSTRCAQLEAKRMQRAREKQRSKKVGSSDGGDTKAR